MLKNWSKFNEKSEFKSTEEFDREELIEHAHTVRDNFMDFEDLGIVESYSFGYSGSIRNTKYEPRAGYSFTPGGRLSIDEVVEEWVNFFKLDGGIKRTERKPFIKVSIRFPSEGNNSVINSDGIKLFENVLEVNSRLVDIGYDIKLDMNGSHPQWKPMSFKLYFKFTDMY